VQGDDFEILARPVQLDESLGYVAPPRQEDEDGAISRRLLLVEVEDEVHDEVHVNLVLLPAVARLKSGLAVRFHALGTRSAFSDVARFDLVVDLPDRVVVWLLSGIVASLLALALAARTRQRRAELHPLARVLPIVVLHWVHPPRDIHRLERVVAVDASKVAGKILCLQRGTHQHYLEVLHPAFHHRVPDQQQHMVCIDVALVHLVKDEAADALQIRF